MAQPKVADPVAAAESPEPCRPQLRVPGELQGDSAQRIDEFVGGVGTADSPRIVRARRAPGRQGGGLGSTSQMSASKE